MFRARLISPALVLMKRENLELCGLRKLGSELLEFLDTFFESRDDGRLARFAKPDHEAIDSEGFPALFKKLLQTFVEIGSSLIRTS